MEYPFGFEILDPGKSPNALCTGFHPCSVAAMYLDQVPYQFGPYAAYAGRAFRFKVVDSGSPMTLTVRSGYADRVHLVPDTTYRLIAHSVLGWPSTFGLVIKEDDDLVFLGLADWELDRTLSIGCLSPVRAEQVRILADHYREGDSCYDRFTNTEIAFLHAGESVLLHQGQSATLGDYEINLEIARTIDHHYCQDAGLNNISFTISRRYPGGSGSSAGTVGTAESGPPASSASIAFPDPALEWFIRRLIQKDTGPILASDLEQPVCFLKLYPLVWSGGDVPNRGRITDLRGLEHCTNLTAMVLSGDNVTDLSPLARLPNLSRLHVERSELADLSPLEGLVSLTQLRINDNQVSDLSPLSSLINLTDLYAPHNQIADISALSSLTSLSQLNLYGNSITDLSPLSPLVNLTQLSLYRNQIADVSPLSSLTHLTNLALYGNQITDVSALSSLVNLTGLRLGGNQIEDISALAHLTELRMVDLSGNQIADISPLAQNPGLGEGDHVYLDGNPLSADSFEADLLQLFSRGVHVSR
jgi:Leucine-rich repeat (LRR) protein